MISQKKSKPVISIQVFIQINLLCTVWLIGTSCCNKSVQIPPPANTIVTEQVFNNDANANAAILGIYSKMLSQSTVFRFTNSSISLLCGLSSDELQSFFTDPGTMQFYQNNLLNNNVAISQCLWNPAYSYLYPINSAIEQLSKATSLSEHTRLELLAEAKFLRAFCYFYLINLFGDVPLVTSTDWQSSSLKARANVSAIYSMLIEDLESAIEQLPDDYSRSRMERSRANKWAATALLARIYLYQGNWSRAEELSGQIISNTGLFELKADLNSIFLKNSSEAILQWSISNSVYPYNITPEGSIIIPYDYNSNPTYYISALLLKSFEPDDLRKKYWIDSCEYDGQKYFYPYKYKAGSAQSNPNAPITEYYMVFRLAEQYLIRAEARAEQSNVYGAISDINIIRKRAGLPGRDINNNKDSVLKYIAQERKIELFAEWGHRWFDLKRTKKIGEVMTSIAPYKGATWNTNMQLYPIPIVEIGRDPNLTQNPGYN